MRYKRFHQSTPRCLMNSLKKSRDNNKKKKEREMTTDDGLFFYFYISQPNGKANGNFLCAVKTRNVHQVPEVGNVGFFTHKMEAQ